MKQHLITFAFATVALLSGRVFALEGAIGVHDPSTVAICDGKYYVYGTGRGVSVLTVYWRIVVA